MPDEVTQEKDTRKSQDGPLALPPQSVPSPNDIDIAKAIRTVRVFQGKKREDIGSPGIVTSIENKQRKKYTPEQLTSVILALGCATPHELFERACEILNLKALQKKAQALRNQESSGTGLQ